MPKEIETKFKIESTDTFKRNLKKIGAIFISEEFEEDTYYRSPAGCPYFGTIRLRAISNKGTFTIKDSTQRKKSRIYKVRNELEVSVNDVKTFNNIVQKLGFIPCFRKEKIRETYRWKDAKISIDKLPFISFYVEIEASKKRIEEVVSLLDLDIKKAIPDTYMKLFNYYKILHKKPKLQLVFDRKK